MTTVAMRLLAFTMILSTALESRIFAEDNATQLAATASSARATWGDDFPGFEASVVIRADDELIRGRVSVAKGGEITLKDVPEKALADRQIGGAIRSLISHRFARAQKPETAKFGDGSPEHPFGRLLEIEAGERAGAEIRVRGDIMHDIKRKTKDGHFTISVLDVYNNPDGKHLPKTFTINTWDTNGDLVSSGTVRDEWVRVGSWDLPQSHFAIRNASNLHRVIHVEFADHRLIGAE